MPNFRAHTTTNLLALGGLSYAAVTHYDVAVPLVWIGATSFVVATFLLSPDLDLRRSSPTRNWGVFRWLWLPYQALFKHRGLSHSLLFSSLTRLGYLTCLALIGLIAVHSWADPTPASIAASASLVPKPAQAAMSAHGEQLVAAGVGIALSDICHIFTDRLVSALKAFAKF